ncbi:MAG: cation transporter [Clostridia bacterium]|nr:cation transporter [Clostridia bacterium]
MQKCKTNKKTAYKVSLVTIFANVVLAIFKMIAGIVAKSGAMISDAIHSASDVFSTIIVMIGIKAANKQADDKHQYGHERLECVAAILLAVVLCITGAGIAIDGVNKIMQGFNGTLAIPGLLALIAAVVSIVVKEGMFWYTKHYAKKINSGAMMADAWHHRSDALSSVGSLIGVGGAMLGLPILDPVASLVICIFIFKAAIDIAKDALDKMIDTACDEQQVEKMKTVILSVDGVLGIDDVKTRLFGDKIYIDIEICCDGNLTLFESHDIAEQVHDLLEQTFDNVKHCTVHVNPK